MKEKRYWWVTMHNNAHFKTLEVKSDLFKEEDTHNEKWDNNIYFDNEEDANEFLKKLQFLIQTEYPRANSEKWYHIK